MHTLRYLLGKFAKRAYVTLATAFAFAATVAPALIRADMEPQLMNPSGTPAPAAGVQAAAGAPASTLPLVPNEDQSITLAMRVTAYSSSADETDNTPFITAMGTRTRDGIVATNILPFGTKVQIPDLFGKKVFTVEDRMAPRMKNVLDIWMPSKRAALRFGVQEAEVVIVEPVAKAVATAKEISKR